MADNNSEIERKLVSILSADVAGYSRLMAENEEATLKLFREHKVVFESIVKMHKGRIFNTAGDAILAEFSSAVEAVRAATEIQSALRTRNDKLPEGRQVCFRIGVNLGDVIIQDGDLLGDGVNIAARLQAAAEPGGICVSGSIYDQIQNKLSISVDNMGEQVYKNIPNPVRTFSIRNNEKNQPFPTAARKAEKGGGNTLLGFPAFYVAGAVGAVILSLMGIIGFSFSRSSPAPVTPAVPVAQTQPASSAPGKIETLAVVPLPAPGQQAAPVPAAAPAPAPAPAPQAAITPKSVDRDFVKYKTPAATVVIDSGLAAAIEKASPGDVIELKPGVYKEHLTLNKKIVIRGQEANGKVGAVVEWIGMEAVDMSDGEVMLENLVFLFTPAAGAKSPATIMVSGGKLSLRNVYGFSGGIASSTLSIRGGAVVAENSEFTGYRGIEQLAGKFECIDCVANGNKEEGAIFYNQGDDRGFRTSLRNFEANRNGLNGLAVMAKAKVTCEGCRINENGVNGVLVNADGVGIFKDTHIDGNKENGLVATDDGLAEFVNSVATKNTYSGLAATLRSKLVIEKSELTGNGEFGYALIDQAKADERGNKITGNRGGGAYRVPASAPAAKP